MNLCSTALFYAAMEGSVDVCAELLQAGASPDVKDTVNMTPLIHAVSCAPVCDEEDLAT